MLTSTSNAAIRGLEAYCINRLSQTMVHFFLTDNLLVQELPRVQANHATHLENCCYAQEAKRTLEELPHRVDGRQELMFLHCLEANNARHILLAS